MLEEAYGTVTETDHSTLRAAQTDEENAKDDREAAGLKAQGKQMEDDLKEEEGNVNEEIDPQAAVEMAAMDRPAADEESPMPGEQPDDLDKDVQDLISLIANPPPEEELVRLGYEGRLSEYVAMLQKKVDAAQAQLDIKKPKEETN